MSGTPRTFFNESVCIHAIFVMNCLYYLVFLLAIAGCWLYMNSSIFSPQDAAVVSVSLVHVFFFSLLKGLLLVSVVRFRCTHL